MTILGVGFFCLPATPLEDVLDQERIRSHTYLMGLVVVLALLLWYLLGPWRLVRLGSMHAFCLTGVVCFYFGSCGVLGVVRHGDGA